MDNFQDPRMEQVRDDLIAIVRDKLKEVGDRNSDYEYNLTSNDYGFATAWIEDECEVWWDKVAGAMQLDEVTELAALYDTILKTEKEIEEQNQ